MSPQLQRNERIITFGEYFFRQPNLSFIHSKRKKTAHNGGVAKNLYPVYREIFGQIFQLPGN